MASKVGDCDCGFVDSNDPTKSTFTSFFVVNFSSITRQQLDDIFIPATYEISQRDAPYTRNFSSNQVQLSEAGLDLTVSPSPDSTKVPCAQVFTRAANFFYGSYHAQFRATDVPGTVTAFFNYKNDTSEVDIEYLSAWDDPTLLYTVKPQIYLDNGTPSNSTYQRDRWDNASASFHHDFHEWSYVWLPDIVHFGLDSNYSKSLNTNIPQAPGRLALSQWSDGNSKYSRGPPTQSSTVTVSALWAVYNDTKAVALTCQKATSACTITKGVFQANDGGGGGNNEPTPPSVILMNSSHSVSPAAPGWFLALLLVYWMGWGRAL
jgi:hypothetical protein